MLQKYLRDHMSMEYQEVRKQYSESLKEIYVNLFIIA